MQDKESKVTPPSSLIGRDCSLSSSGGSRKRVILSVTDETTDILVEYVKKCRVSSTPGELRLKKDLVECDQLLAQGIARFDKSLGNPLKCRLTFLSLIGVMQMVQPQAEASAVAAKSAIVPTTFSITVPKFYPHEPPLIYTDRCYSRTCSFVDENGKLHLPFLSSSEWSSVQTMKCITQMLLEVLQHHASGQQTRKPWGQSKLGTWQGTLPWKNREANPTTTPGGAHNLASLDDRARAETPGNTEIHQTRGDGLNVTYLNSGSTSTCTESAVSNGYGESLAGDARAMATREHCFWSAGRDESPVSTESIMLP